MSLLKRIGVISANIAGIIAGVGPLILPGRQGVIDQVLNVFEEFATAVATVEQIGAAVGMPGPDKFKAVLPLFGQILGRSVLVRTHGIKDQALYEKAIAGYGQATVDLLNSLDSKKVKTEELAA